MSELIKHVELGQKGEDSPEVTSEFRNLKPSTERPIYSSSVVGGTLGERTVSPGHLVRIRSVADQDKLKGEIEKTSQKIADLKSARMSTGKIIKWALIAAAVVGGIIAVAAGIFAAPLLCCIVVGVLVGVLAGAVTGVALHKNNCARQVQIETLENLQGANVGLVDANKGLIDAYANLATMEGELNEQKATVTQQGATIEEQQRLVAEQTARAESLQQKNAELGQNLEGVQQAREEASRQAQEIQSKAEQLEFTLESIRNKVAKNEARIAELRKTNEAQAAKLQRQTDAMKAFVNQQREMVSQLESTVKENQKYLDGMLEKVQMGGDAVRDEIEKIKAYVKSEFDAVQAELTAATTKSSEILANLEDGETAATIEMLVEAQKLSNRAILSSVARLGIMQAAILDALTNVQTTIQEQQAELVAAISELQQKHTEAMGNIKKLGKSYDDAQGKLDQCKTQMNNALTRATQLDSQADKDPKVSEAVQWAMKNSQQLNRQAAKLKKELDKIGEELTEARTHGSEMDEAYRELVAKQEQIQANCAELEQQNQALRTLNEKLFGQAQSIGQNLGVIGEGIDQAATAVGNAVDASSGVTSKWSRFGAILGAGLGGAGATAIGAGALTAGVAAAAGVVALPLVGVLVAAYMAGGDGKYIASARAKIGSLASGIGATVSASLKAITTFGRAITTFGKGIASLLSQMAGQVQSSA